MTLGRACVALVVAFAIRTGAADESKGLKSRDVRQRLAAVEALRKDGAPDAEAQLVSVLDDSDWEVEEQAATALATRGGPASVAALTRLAVEGRVRRVRTAAVKALARIDAPGAVRLLAKKTTGEEALAAVEAIATLSTRTPDDAWRKPIERALKSKETPMRAAAVAALVAVADEPGRERIAKLLADPDVVVACAMADAMRETPRVEWIAPLLARLVEPDVPEVLDRRLVAGIVAAVATKPRGPESAEAARPALAAAAVSRTVAGASRLATLVGRLGERPPDAEPPPPAAAGAPPVPAPEVPLPLGSGAEATTALSAAVAHKDEGVRAAAAAALGLVRSEESLAKAGAMTTDVSPRVRMAALRSLIAGRGAADERVSSRLVSALVAETDPGVKELVATALGIEGVPAAVDALSRATQDGNVGVAICAAVSLGKTRAPAAVAPLTAMLGKHVKDWRLRGAAVAGLGYVRRKEAVPALIGALLEKDPSVSRTAWEFLRRMTTREFPPDAEVWKSWWAEVAPKYEFLDLKKAAVEAKKGGYSPTAVGVYEHLDVVVLQSRGDHIEDMLDHLGIEHRIVRAAGVSKAGLHPFCLFVSNCTGEIVESDVERLQWFVRVGGYLFGSCWALHYTIEPIWPGFVRKLETKAEVLDDVVARPCPVASPYFEGVFASFTQPIYVLYGSHLIEVLRPEAVEVLIDAPQAAAHWGGGNLAAWFPAGHGVILDSANHFNLQGLERVTGLKTAADRMAYSIDHKGLDWDDVRKLEEDHVWDSQAKSVDRVRDLSAFRFITNFVRQKRKADL